LGRPGVSASSNAILVATTPTTPTGTGSTNRGSAGEVAPRDVNPSASSMTGTTDSVASSAPKSPSSNNDQFWIALGSDQLDPLTLSLT
jgi:hypothetical protein